MSQLGINSNKEQENAESVKPKLFPSPNFGKWIQEIGGTVVFTTYQSSRIFFLSADEEGKTVALERIVGSAMGIAVDKDKLWVSNKEQVWRFSNVGGRKVPLNDGDASTEYDAVYMPRWGIFLGGCDTHDLLANVSHDGRHYELLFVNTNFSCIASIDGHYNFLPVWKPSFISALSPEDRCHLNGMGSRDGKLAYATACAQTDTGYEWKSYKNGGGVLIDIQKDEIICKNLSMPHSPRWHDGKVWLLNSGEGEFGYVDPDEKKFIPVLDCPGFARGLTIIGHYALIGLSKLRENTFSSGLNIKTKLQTHNIEERCGILVVDLHTCKLVHWLSITGSVTELYDVAVIEGIKRPHTPGFSHSQKQQFFNIPDVFPIMPPSVKVK